MVVEKDRKGFCNCNCDAEIPNEISVIVVKKKKGDCVDRRYVSHVILCAQIDWVTMKMRCKSCEKVVRHPAGLTKILRMCGLCRRNPN